VWRRKLPPVSSLLSLNSTSAPYLEIAFIPDVRVNFASSLSSQLPQLSSVPVTFHQSFRSTLSTKPSSGFLVCLCFKFVNLLRVLSCLVAVVSLFALVSNLILCPCFPAESAFDFGLLHNLGPVAKMNRLERLTKLIRPKSKCSCELALRLRKSTAYKILFVVHKLTMRQFR